MKVVIIGWTSGFGKWLAWYIKKYFDVNVIVTWTNEEKAKKVANELNINYSLNNIEVVKDADIVIFSVPISLMEQTIKEVWPYINPTAIVADVCSIKWFVYDALNTYCPKSCTIIPTHPMFGPYIQDIVDQVIVLTPSEKVKNTEVYRNFKKFLKEKWAKTIETTPDYHDKLMAVVQWLTHITMFMIGETIRRLNVPVEETLKFVSPVYKLLISSVLRYVGHDPKLYWDIQMYNSKVLEVHSKMMEVIWDFNKMVLNKDESKFISTIEATKNFMWDKNCKIGQLYTDKIIYLLAEQKDKFDKNIWKIVKLKNIYTGELIEDKILKIEDDKVFLEKTWEISLYEFII